jgi:L-histidine Nalpha-methyltransferase
LQALGRSSWFLVGVDLRKDPAILLPAYDDAQGVTAAFNRNLLVRLNREAGANFDLDSFAHRVVWNDAASRIEMHLESLREQVVSVGGQPIHFAQGETIHTENSYKYAPERFAGLAQDAGWHCAQLWTDPRQLYSLHLLEPRRSP